MPTEIDQGMWVQFKSGRWHRAKDADQSHEGLWYGTTYCGHTFVVHDNLTLKNSGEPAEGGCVQCGHRLWKETTSG